MPLAIVMTILSLSALGMPPFSGFWGKFFVFGAAISADLWWFAAAGLVASVIAAFYYLRIIKLMWFDAPRRTMDKAAARNKMDRLCGCGLFLPGGDPVPAPCLSGGADRPRRASAVRSRTVADFEIFDTCLPPRSWPCQGCGLGGRPGWILAKEQTKGVGRHGRIWVGTKGNFMASRYDIMALDVRRVPQLSFVTALAVYEMLRPFVPDTDRGDAHQMAERYPASGPQAVRHPGADRERSKTKAG